MKTIRLLMTFAALAAGSNAEVHESNASASPTIYTYSLGSNTCDFAWVTSVYYDYGRHDTLLRVSGWGDEYYSLLKCNFANLPAGATKATLRLYKFAESGSRSAIYLDRVTGNWDNNTKWPARPSAVNVALLPAPVGGQWYDIDITNLFNGWQENLFPNLGIQLRPVSNNDVFNSFWSPAYSDPELRPKLVLTYAAPIGAQHDPPAIELLGPNPLSVAFGTKFVDPGYTATDRHDGNITAKVVVSGSVNTALAGTYTLTYDVVDSAGLAATPRTRTVKVLDAPGLTTTGYEFSEKNCSFVWVTNVYYGFGQHSDDLRAGGWGDLYYSLLKCSIPGPQYPAVKAVLRLYPAPKRGSYSPLYLDRVTGDWNNSTRWQNRPAAVNISTLPAPVDDQWYEIDITGLYNDGSFARNGIQLRAVSNNDVFDDFLSPLFSDNTFTPQLVITKATGN